MTDEKQIWPQKMVEMIKENSLTITFFTLFVMCIVAQSFTGWRVHNQTLSNHGHAVLTYGDYLTTGTFVDGLAVNWQAAVLQLGSLILFSGFLYQRGSPHSRDDRKQRQKPSKRRFGHLSWLYRHSLFMSFLLLFLVTIVMHGIFGAKASNETSIITGGKMISVASYLYSAKFWSSTLQTWQAEYLAIAIYLVLSVFLRQENSAESKPVESDDDETGDANK